jgi:hypothetical protein
MIQALAILICGGLRTVSQKLPPSNAPELSRNEWTCFRTTSVASKQHFVQAEVTN